MFSRSVFSSARSCFRNVVLEKKINHFRNTFVFKRNHGSETTKPGTIEVNYLTKDGKRITVMAAEGDNLMRLAQKHEIEVEGACEASLACCTCHVYVKDEFFEKLESPSEEEEDLLDMAPFLKPNSRLSCQIILTKDLHGIEVQLPPATRNFYVDGAKPAVH